MNSGDWVENLTSLEYNHGEWDLYYYKDSCQTDDWILSDDKSLSIMDLDNKQIFKVLMKEFQL
jgi:hypothetical protein